MAAVKRDAIVVGGGVSGMTAVYALARRGKTSVVFEPKDIGGMMKTARKDGFILEQGPNVLIEKPELRSLIDDVGFRDQVVYPGDDRYKQFVSVNGVPREVPKSAGAFLSSNLFSLSEKVRVVRALFSRSAFRTAAEDESVLEFFSRGLGVGIVNKVLDPVLKGIYGGRIDRLSAAALFPQLYRDLSSGVSLLQYLRNKGRRGGAKPRILVFRNGMRSFVERLLEKSGPFVTPIASEVRAVSWADGCFIVTALNGDVFEAPKLIWTAGLAKAMTAFPSAISESIRPMLERRRSAPLCLVHCSTTDAPVVPKNTFGVLFPEGTRNGLLGIMCNSLVFPHLAPPGRHLMTLCFGGIAALESRENLSPSDETVRDLCRTVVGAEEVKVLNRYLWDAAIPQYECGHGHLVEEIEAIEKRFKGLVIASTDRGGIGVADRVKSVMELVDNER